MDTFRRRLRLIIFLGSGIPLAMAAVLYIVYQVAVHYHHEVQILELRADLLAALVAPPLSRGELHVVGEQLRYVGLMSGVDAAIVYDARGARVAESGRSEGLIVPDRQGLSIQGSRLGVYRRVHLGGARFGEVYLIADLVPVYLRLVQNGAVGLVAISAAFGFAFIIAGRFERRVVRQVERVTAAAAGGIGTSDAIPPPVIAPEDDDGLAELVAAVNALVGRVAESTQRVRESEVCLRTLLNHVTDLIFVLDADGRIRFVNSAVPAQLGYAADELVGRDLRTLIRAEHWPRARELQRQLRQSGGAASELELLHRDGSTRTHEVRVTDQLDNAAVCGIVVGCHDVTERELLAEEVGWQGELLDVVFEQIPGLVYLKDAAEQRYVRVNRAMEAFLGRSRETVVGLTDIEILGRRAGARNRLSDAHALVVPGVSEQPGFEIPSSAGHVRVIDKKVVGIIPENGRPRYLLVTAEEVTERQRMIRALQASEERYRQVVENAGDAFFLHDLKGRFLDVNGRACRSLGYDREELLALSVPEVEMRYEAEKVGRWWAKLRPGRAVTVAGMHRRRDGGTFAVDVRVSVWDHEGERFVIALARKRRNPEEVGRPA